jgi:hypothetical protein
MDNDKISSWLVIVTFFAWAAAIAFVYLETQDLKESNGIPNTSVF